jgi:hypothetical protein
MTPSINRMLKLLPEEEQRYVTKETVINMESAVIHALNFDFALLSPLPFLERFLRLIDYFVLGLPTTNSQAYTPVSD